MILSDSYPTPQRPDRTQKEQQLDRLDQLLGLTTHEDDTLVRALSRLTEGQLRALVRKVEAKVPAARVESDPEDDPG